MDVMHSQNIKKIHVLVVKTPLERLLESVTLDWRKRPLYTWQWDDDGRQDLDPRCLYDLSHFISREFPQIVAIKKGKSAEYSYDYIREALLFNRDRLFLLEARRGSYRNVLTNMPPPHYPRQQKGQEVNLQDFIRDFC